MIRRPLATAMLLLGATLLPVAANAATGYVDGSTELHAGPDYDYPTVAVVDDQAPVEVFGCLEDWSWCDVAFYDDRGWIAGDHLASIYEGYRRPISYVGPYIGLGVLAFSFDSYWDRHYHSRPWYRERSRWDSYSREHYRPAWEGRHAGFERRDNDRRPGNWRDNDRRDNDRNRHDANRTDNDRRDWSNRGNDNDRRDWQNRRGDNDRQQRERVQANQNEARQRWDQQRQQQFQQQQQRQQEMAARQSRIDNAALERRQRDVQQHVEERRNAGRDWGHGMASDGGRQARDFQRQQPQAQPQPQRQGGGENRGHGGGHGGDRDHGGGRGHDKD